MEAFRYFFPGHCYEEVLVKFNVFDGEEEGNNGVVQYVLCSITSTILLPLLSIVGPCLKLLISRLFSLNIILGSILGRYLKHTLPSSLTCCFDLMLSW